MELRTMAAAPRAQWRGSLILGALSVPVALCTAASTSERTSFNMVNRATGNRLRRELIDPTTDQPVAKEDQVKGYELDKDQFVLIEEEDLAAAIPEADKKLAIGQFVDCKEVDPAFLDKPYYVTPSGPGAEASYAVLREAMRNRGVAAIAHAVLFRRYRAVLLRTSGPGIVAHTMNFDYQVRSSAAAFNDLPEIEIKGEMLDLAKHIIGSKRGTFDIEGFTDRYEEKVAELVRAKIEGREIHMPKPAQPTNVVNLLDALRASAGALAKQDKAAKREPRKVSPTRKAG
jgi:DNA end-binding protein Ku